MATLLFLSSLVAAHAAPPSELTLPEQEPACALEAPANETIAVTLSENATAKAIWPKSWAEKFCASMHLPGTDAYKNCVYSLAGVIV